MYKQFKKFLENESGATAIEYALIASLISVGIVGGVSAVGDNSTVNMEYLADNLEPS